VHVAMPKICAAASNELLPQSIDGGCEGRKGGGVLSRMAAAGRTLRLVLALFFLTG
jgi:hypothetical protein